MQKSLVLALALVLGVASASMAATPSFSGNVTVTAESTSGFFGGFTLKPKATVNVDFAESGEGWSLDARLQGTWASGDPAATVKLRYKGVFQAGPVTTTVSRNYDLGTVKTNFGYVSLVGKAGETIDQLRLRASLSGLDVAAQLRSDETQNLRLRAQTTVNDFTLGAGARLGLGGAGSDYTVYGTTKVGIAEFKAAYASFAGMSEGVYGVDVAADVTSNLNVGASYSNATKGDLKKGYAVRATFTEGLLQASAKHYQENSDTTLWVKYRGSDGNLAFGDLFEGDYNDKWYRNVAPAFGVKYSAKTGSASTFDIYALAPLTSSAIARAHVGSSAGKTSFDAEVRFTLNEKTALNPYVKSAGPGTDTLFGAKLIHNVSDNAEITVTAEQKGPTQTLKAAYSINF